MDYKIIIDKTPPSFKDVKNFLFSKKCGAVFIFNGIVRNKNRENEVIALEYEVDEDTGRSLLSDFLNRYENKLEKIYIYQASGKLNVGDDTLIIGASSYSREESFNAVQEILDFMKHKFPVWKKEYYKNGRSHWL